jgi:signal transduction histidine kinase
LTSVEERLFSGLAGQAGLVLRGARLRAELEQRAVELAARAEELRRSRQRLVDDQDAERRKLERDIHDGAQQHLVALAVNLRLAQTLADRSPERAGLLLIEQRRSAAEAIDTLVRLSRGIYPELLTEHGLAAALAAATGTSPVPVELEVDGIGRYSARVEAAAYFCCLEALQNAAKHSGATAITVDLREDGPRLVLAVDDDGGGFDPRQGPVGTGLTSMRDRVESLDGTLAIDSTPLGTRVRATIPLMAVTRDAGTSDADT